VDWSLASSITQVLSVIGAFLIFGYTVVSKVEKKLDSIESETKPNHGSSLRDVVDRIEERLDRMDRELSGLSGQFAEHVRKNS
jgi:hypothetical protein